MGSWIPGVEEVKAFKIVAIFSLLILAAIATLLPIKIKANKRLLSVLNMLGGGVFLSCGLVHLMHEAVHGLHDLGDFPWPFVLCGSGFILTCMMDELAHYLSHKGKKNNQDDIVLQQQSMSEDVNNSYLDNNAIIINNNSNNYNEHLIDEHEHNHECSDDHGHSHDVSSFEGNHSFISALVLWFALSFHSTMEGLAIGASNKAEYGIYVAIMAHKGLESFSLGTSLVRSNVSNLRYFLFCIAFSLMSPIGVALGFAIDELSEDNVAAGVIMSIAAGTFLYIAIVEIILAELKIKQDKVLKFLLLAVGFTGMSIIAIWV